MKENYSDSGMIKSKFNHLLLFLSVTPMLAGAPISFLYFGAGLAGRDKFLLLGSGVIAILVIGLIVRSNAWQVLIDREGRTITTRNLVSKKKLVYSFEELDGFVHVYVRLKNGDKIKVLYLVKDRKFCLKLSGSFYSNLDELESALVPLTFLGVQNLNLMKRIAIVRQRPVL
jgi:hypothetical protein